MNVVFSRQLPQWAARAQPPGEPGRRYGTHLSMCLTSLGPGLLGIKTSATFSHWLRAALRGGWEVHFLALQVSWGRASPAGRESPQAVARQAVVYCRIWLKGTCGPPQIPLQGSYLFTSSSVLTDIRLSGNIC